MERMQYEQQQRDGGAPGLKLCLWAALADAAWCLLLWAAPSLALFVSPLAAAFAAAALARQGRSFSAAALLALLPLFAPVICIFCRWYSRRMYHPVFPKRTNTEFVEVLDKNTVNMRVWERGSDETLACGTGACATTVACILNNKTEDEVTVHLLGGDLKIRWDRKENLVYMTGPATVVFDGEITLPEGTEMVMPGDNVEINVELIYPVALIVGLRFAIREGGRTVGAGQITELLD